MNRRTGRVLQGAERRAPNDAGEDPTTTSGTRVDYCLERLRVSDTPADGIRRVLLPFASAT